MPRAHSQVIDILERLDAVRTSIHDLSDVIHHQVSLHWSYIRWIL